MIQLITPCEAIAARLGAIPIDDVSAAIPFTILTRAPHVEDPAHATSLPVCPCGHWKKRLIEASDLKLSLRLPMVSTSQLLPLMHYSCKPTEMAQAAIFIQLLSIFLWLNFTDAV